MPVTLDLSVEHDPCSENQYVVFRIVLQGESTLSRFHANAIRLERYRGSDRKRWQGRKVHYPAYSVCRGGAAPRKESASLRGTSRPCGGQYQCRSRAIVPRWCRRRGSQP